MSHVQSFPPVAIENARVLILGSMPGLLSLEKQQYYAHPRNGFWPIMAEMFCFDVNAPYLARLQALTENRVALWDVLQACFRPGSLDSAIDEQSIVTNNFAEFLSDHPDIHSIFFNGAKAEQMFVKHVAPELTDLQRTFFMMRLPSTSPANAGVTLSDKAQQWRVVKQHAQNAVL